MINVKKQNASNYKWKIAFSLSGRSYFYLNDPLAIAVLCARSGPPNVFVSACKNAFEPIASSHFAAQKPVNFKESLTERENESVWGLARYDYRIKIRNWIGTHLTAYPGTVCVPTADSRELATAFIGKSHSSSKQFPCYSQAPETVH